MEKKDYFIIGLLGAIFTLIIVILIVVISNNNKKEEETPQYDVSMMRSISVNGALKLFEDKDIHVLYIGRETCSVCVKLLPILQDAQKENDYITQYMDITKIDRNSENWEKLVKKLDLKTTAELGEMDNGSETVTETFGYFLDNYGFTPTVIIIKQGKQVAGFVGYKSLEEFNDWYDAYNS